MGSGRLYCFVLGLTLNAVSLLPAMAQDDQVDVGEPFGTLSLIDQVIVGENEDEHGFVESAPGVSVIEEILGRPTRVLVNEAGARFFGYRLGAGQGLSARKAYLLHIEYPEDVARTIYVVNRGGEYARGFSTGAALGDTARGYTNQNLESIAYPLSGQHENWHSMFFIHDRYQGQKLVNGGPMARPETPNDGFMVFIAQPGSWRGGPELQAPVSAGAAVSRISLYEVPDPDAISAPIRYPAGELPRRYIFWREEMADGVVGFRNNQPAYDDEVIWFENKARMMKFLGANTYSKDLLEFGANQGWDSTPHGGNDWVHQSDNPQRWSNILEMLGRYDFYVLPMYEYAGSKGEALGLGYKRRARPLRRDPTDNDGQTPCDGYTHIWWAERANVDILDPDALEDLRKIFDATIFRHKDRVTFLGAWLRQRNSAMPMSFSELALDAFTSETMQPMPTTRQMLIDTPELLERYYAWWFDKRRDYLGSARHFLKEALGDSAVLLYTAFHEESGPLANGAQPVTDDPARWMELGFNPQPFDDATAPGAYLEGILTPPGSWDEATCMVPVKRRYEWNHSTPRPDPENAKRMPGFLFTYPFHRLYSTGDVASFDAFRGPAGLAVIRHYSLNENTMDAPDEAGMQSGLLGYFVTDVERAGPYSMLAEARALAFGDPRYLGYLTSLTVTHGFPKYAQRFNSAFLALPAVPSEIREDASNQAAIVVRAYPTAEHGTYYAAINTGLEPLNDVTLNLPTEAEVVDAVREETVAEAGARPVLSFEPGQVYALRQDIMTEPIPTQPLGGEDGSVPVNIGGAPATTPERGASGGMGAAPTATAPPEGGTGTSGDVSNADDSDDEPTRRVLRSDAGAGEASATTDSAQNSGGCVSVNAPSRLDSIVWCVLALGFLRRRWCRRLMACQPMAHTQHDVE